jgi:hydroxyacylglutathione hydrolase
VAYFCDAVEIGAASAPLVFCGDTLFSGGCGRLFEGTPAQMHASLTKLAALPGATRVCCTHEYTLSNLRFALTVEPGNVALQAYAQACKSLREQGLPTLPSSVATERAINPFLRSAEPELQASAQQAPGFVPLEGAGAEINTFAALRHWKNVF